MSKFDTYPKFVNYLARKYKIDSKECEDVILYDETTDLLEKTLLKCIKYNVISYFITLICRYENSLNELVRIILDVVFCDDEYISYVAKYCYIYKNNMFQAVTDLLSIIPDCVQ